MTRAACLSLVAALGTPHGLWQSQPPIIRTTTAGVLIDVTVVDNRGQPVLDLSADDFELTEDGQSQQLLSVTLVRSGVARAVDPRAPLSKNATGGTLPATAPSSSPDSSPHAESTPTVTAILFDKLSPDLMPYAVRSALAYASTLVPPFDYAGIFLADLNLRTFEPFTNDQARLRGAIERVSGTATANLRPDAGRAGDLYVQRMDPSTPPTAGAESPGGSASVAERQRMLASLDVVQRKMAEVSWRMEAGFRQLLAEYEGESSIAGLRAVVDALAILPGRKSILYFTESLPITDRLKPKFEALIGQANRANITVYPVDAAGLRLHSKEAELSRNVNLAGAQGIGDASRADGPWTKELERQDQLLGSRPSAVLGRLAKETGGFVIENTNNLGAGVARMQQERTTYYLLGYQPTNVTMDGKFRRVRVRVDRPRATVTARPGYLALPAQTP